MRTLTADEATSNWRRLTDKAARQPVKLVGDGQPMIVMSEAEFERLTGMAWDRLFSAMDRLGAEARASGLDETRLEELLAKRHY